MSFSKISGQDKALETLKGFIASKRIPGAMIFYGPAGVGKATAALEFAKTLNCLDGYCAAKGDNCSLCSNCKHIEAGTHPDVIFADFAYQAMLKKEEPEKQQSIKVDTVRALTAASQQKAVAGRWKVFIIDSAETLQTEAANALLKFIEEPPENTVWILISSKKEAMLNTIKSRCQAIAFSPLEDKVLIDILKDNFVEESLARRAVKYAQGSGTNAFRAAEILGEISTLPGGAAFPTAFALNLPRTLAQSRAQVSFTLDMLAVAAHENWIKSGRDKQGQELKNLLSKLVFYKKAIARNVSPSMVAEAALISALDLGISLKD